MKKEDLIAVVERMESRPTTCTPKILEMLNDPDSPEISGRSAKEQYMSTVFKCCESGEIMVTHSGGKVEFLGWIAALYLVWKLIRANKSYEIEGE